MVIGSVRRLEVSGEGVPYMNGVVSAAAGDTVGDITQSVLQMCKELPKLIHCDKSPAA